MDAPIHVERFRDGSKRLDKIRLAESKTVLRKADSHKERTIMEISRMLVGLEDIAVVLENKLGDRCDNSWLVWA